MRIIAKRTLVEYYTKNPLAKSALESWYQTTLKAEWKNFADIQKTFATVSSVGNHRYVFNIKGNDYRLIVLIKFTVSHVNTFCRHSCRIRQNKRYSKFVTLWQK